MYHTHINDLFQLSSGLYGALIVLPEGTTFHPESDKVLVLSRNGKRKDGELLLNGSTAPAPLALRDRRGALSPPVHRYPRNNSIVIKRQFRTCKPVEWTPIAKDGADLAVGAIRCNSCFVHDRAGGDLRLSHSRPSKAQARSSLSTTLSCSTNT